MVQILEDFSPSSQRFAGFSQLLQGLGQGAEKLKGSLDERQTRNALQERFGDIFGKVRDPQARSQLLSGEIEKEKQRAKLEGEHVFDQKTYDTIKEQFSEKDADLYRAATEGGKTTLLGKLLEGRERNKDLNEKLGIPTDESDINDEEQISEEFPREKPAKTIDFDKGLTLAERTRRQDARYKTNLPLFTDSLEKRRASETEKEELAILEDLSPRIGAIERLNINPVSGNLILPAAASEDAQRYVKTINDFTRNAKESYGARVTNFDLQQFMKRLPTLANSEEGRRQIIEQLQILNNINLTHSKALHDTFEQHGGIRNIDYDQAQAMADKKSQKQIENLKSKFRDIGSKNDKEYHKQNKEFKRMVPKDHVAVLKSTGERGYIPKEKLKTFLEVPGNEAL
jgi:hypothetical protein